MMKRVQRVWVENFYRYSPNLVFNNNLVYTKLIKHVGGIKFVQFYIQILNQMLKMDKTFNYN